MTTELHSFSGPHILVIVLMYVSRSCLALDEQSLLTFRQSIRDPKGVLADWNSSLTVCNWTGVTCDSQGFRVTELRLNSHQLAGSISSAIGGLTFLKVIDLSNNSFTGSLTPDIGNCSKLNSLLLSSNHLTGPLPFSLGDLKLLKRLHLSNNAFTSRIPTTLGQCSALTDLNLSGNFLGGKIPASLGNCSSLALFNMSANLLTGSIPPSLGNLFNLSRLHLSSNLLTGEVPIELFNLSQNLGDVEMSNNLLTGSLPDEFDQFRFLSNLDLSYNTFAEKIPSSLGLCQPLIYLNLYHNAFTGPIPLSIGSLDQTFQISLDMSHNLLSGPIPEGLGNLRTTVSIDISGVRRWFFPLVYAGGSVLAFGFLVLVASWLDIVKIRAARNQGRDVVTSYSCGLQIIRLTVEDLQTATDGFNESHVIGRGGTSIVYRGFLRFYPFIFAVKKFADDEDGRQRLLKEAGILRHVRHRNLVGNLGISAIPRSINVLALEYMANGTLNQHLYQGTVCELSWDVRLKLVTDVATAVLYLHEEAASGSAIIHGDLKPANIFLDSNFTAKVGDFGGARLLEDVGSFMHNEDSKGKLELSFGYVPPGDVYSFGVVILEIVTRRRPTDIVTGELGDLTLIQWVQAALPDKLKEIVDPSLADSEDFISSRDGINLFLKVGLFCTAENPRERPKMRDALAMIRQIDVRSSSCSPAMVKWPVPNPFVEQTTDESCSSTVPSLEFQHDFVFDIRDSAAYNDGYFRFFKWDMGDGSSFQALLKHFTNLQERARQARSGKSRIQVWRSAFGRKNREILEAT